MEKTLKVVIVGCGSISGVWLKQASEIPGLEIVGLVDLLEDMARNQAAEFGIHQAMVGSDLAAMLEATRPDMVFDCTVPEAHATVTLESLQRGCHVLGEKPMADSMDNARRMVAAAQSAGKIYAVIQNRRYQPEIRQLRQLVASGALGPLTTVNSDFYIGAHFGGFREQMQHVLLLDMAIHTFDAARFLTGADPISVYCKEWNPPGSWYAHGASAVAIFELSGGLIYTYRGSWCAEGLPTRWESEWRLVGQQGSARWDGGAGLAAEVVAQAAGFISEYLPVSIPPNNQPEKTGGHAGLIREFVDCVRSGKTPETIGSDNIKSLAMVYGAIESAQLGKPVKIEI
jgi:predicted dehydrogenase